MKTATLEHFYYVKGAAQNTEHKLSAQNGYQLARNWKEQIRQSPHGILNFTYTMEIL
jgi:hypothetical protein